ncbi:MAG: glycosyltransferase family 2 protein [Planctomycetota bacterium]
MPAVSIVMACYNGMPYLPDAIDSIRKQTFSDWELIVVNDGSTDGSSHCLNEYAAEDSRIRVLDQPNQGQHVAADIGIREAVSPLIARMDADDVCHPHRLEKQLRFLSHHPEVGLVGSQIRRLGSHRAGLRSLLPTDHATIWSMLRKNHHALCNPTVVFRKSLYERVGGYWCHDIAEDWDLFLRLGEISQLANLDEVLLHYRFHGSSINGRRIIQAQLYNEYAAHLSRLRESSQPEISIEDFKREHAISRWPHGWLFRADALSIGQYRQAVAELYGGQRLRGTARLLMSMMMSPQRTLRRCARMLHRSPAVPTESNNSASTPAPKPSIAAALSPIESRDRVRA